MLGVEDVLLAVDDPERPTARPLADVSRVQPAVAIDRLRLG